MRGTRCVRRSRAFTLIELLVVIAIIALLIAILHPRPRKGRWVGETVHAHTLSSAADRGLDGTDHYALGRPDGWPKALIDRAALEPTVPHAGPCRMCALAAHSVEADAAEASGDSHGLSLSLQTTTFFALIGGALYFHGPGRSRIPVRGLPKTLLHTAEVVMHPTTAVIMMLVNGAMAARSRARGLRVRERARTALRWTFARTDVAPPPQGSMPVQILTTGPWIDVHVRIDWA